MCFWENGAKAESLGFFNRFGVAVGIIFVGHLSSELLSLVVFYGPRHILGLTSLLLLGFQWKGKNQCEIFVAAFDDRDHGYLGTWKLMGTFSYCISAVDKNLEIFNYRS